MKKALAIILCIVAVCFASCNKENANQKFIGNYSGNMTAILTLSAIGQQMNTDPIEVPTELQISAGNSGDKVVALFTIEEETRTLTGTANDNVVDFDPLVIDAVVEGLEVSMTIDLDGILDGTSLNVTGNINGSGTIVDEQLPMPMPFTASGTANGILNKVVQ